MRSDRSYNNYFFCPKSVAMAIYYGLKYGKKLELYLHYLFREKAFELYKAMEEDFLEDFEN